MSTERWLLVVLLLLAGCTTAPAETPPRVSLPVPTSVPIQVIDGVTLVSASINRSPSAVLIVDTGAQWTILSPLAVKRFGVVVPDNAPRRKLAVVGGQTIDVPFVRIATLRVGEAVVEDFEVGVYEIFPQTKILDGLLGSDFLHRFRVTVDKAANHMRLEPLPH